MGMTQYERLGPGFCVAAPGQVPIYINIIPLYYDMTDERKIRSRYQCRL